MSGNAQDIGALVDHWKDTSELLLKAANKDDKRTYVAAAYTRLSQLEDIDTFNSDEEKAIYGKLSTLKTSVAQELQSMLESNEYSNCLPLYEQVNAALPEQEEPVELGDMLRREYQTARSSVQKGLALFRKEVPFNGNVLSYCKDAFAYAGKKISTTVVEETKRKKDEIVDSFIPAKLEDRLVDEVAQRYEGRVDPVIGSAIGFTRLGPRGISHTQAQKCKKLALSILSTEMDETGKERIIKEIVQHGFAAYTDVLTYFSSEILVREPHVAQACVTALKAYKEVQDAQRRDKRDNQAHN